MAPSTFVTLLAAAVQLGLALALLISGRGRPLHRACAAWCLGLGAWCLGLLMVGRSPSPAAAQTWLRLAWVGLLFSPVAFLHFVGHLLRPPRPLPWAGYLLAGAACLLQWRPWPLPGTPQVGVGASVWAHPLASALVAGALATCFVIAARRIARARSDRPAHDHRRTRWLFALLVPGLLGAANDLLPALGFATYPWTLAPVAPLGGWTALGTNLVFVIGLAAGALVDMRIALARCLPGVLRFCLLTLVYAALLFAVARFAPGFLGPRGVVAALGAFVAGALIVAVLLPDLLPSPAARLRARFHGRDFVYLEKLHALRDVLDQDPRLDRALTHVCSTLRETLCLGAVDLSYRDHAGTVRLVPPPHGSSYPEQAAIAEDMAREATLWLNREDLWVIPLRTIGDDPVGHLRVRAHARDHLLLNELDREVIAELAGAIAYRIERESIHESLELRRANAAKDRFLAGINHEIRNPLNGLVGLIPLLRAENPAGRSADLLSTMSACAAQLTAALDNTLDFTRLSSGAELARAARFELAATLRDSVAHHELESPGRIRHQLPAEPCWLLGDAGKLRQIVANFVGNALKYGEPPVARLGARVRGGLARGHTLLVEVSNPAPIDPDEDLAAWFKPFRRGRRALATRTPGSGLGLAICERLATVMGGNVGAHRRGEELVFWLSVPISPAQPPSPADPAPLLASPPAPRTAPLRVLAIEDEEYNRIVLEHHLRSWGLHVDRATDGAGALAQVASVRPDLIVMDWMLGDTDGDTLLPSLLALCSPHPPPVIVLSAYDTEEKRQQALSAGARLFLTKPLDPARLLAAIHEFASSAPLPLPPSTSAPGPLQPDASALAARLRQDWDEARPLFDPDPEAAAHIVHRMRGRARLLPPSELPDALADLERALFDKAPAPVRRAARTAVEHLLDSPHHPTPPAPGA